MAGAGRSTPRPPRVLVIILDGTLSSLQSGWRTNAGRTYRLLQEQGTPVTLYYAPGLQWRDWRSGLDVLTGRGINRQIRRAYGWLASRYRPGDRIYLFGYSRGAYAVRSLAGVMDQIGLLRADQATARRIKQVYRFYEHQTDTAAVPAFVAAHCHREIEIEMIGVWDTVKSLGVNAPVLWRLSAPRHAFHNHALGRIVKRGVQALAHDETRVAYAPVLWATPAEEEEAGSARGRLIQMWFPGVHGDVGGQLNGHVAARPLSNIALVWLLQEAEAAGLPLPQGWADRYVQDPLAPSVGMWRGAGRILMTRRRRRIGFDPSEHYHPSIALRAAGAPRKPARWWTILWRTWPARLRRMF